MSDARPMTDPAPPGETVEGRTRLGAYALCLDDERRILLARLSAEEVEVGAWTLPGGGVDFGEHPDAAVLRELEEETGLRGEIESVAGMFSHVYPKSRAAQGRDLHFLGVLYRVRVVGGELRDETDGSTDACDWFTRTEADRLRVVEIGRVGIQVAFDGPRR